MALKKPSARSATSLSDAGGPSAGKLLVGWPTILEFLCLRVWPDGSPRSVGKVALYTEENRWKAFVTDPNGPRVAFVTAETPDDLLALLDEGLATDQLDWRQDKFAEGKKAKGR